jgi:hypothetical protein
MMSDRLFWRVDIAIPPDGPSGKVGTSLGDDEFRRSIYVQVRRSMPLGVLEPFDLPRMTPNCEKRAASTAAPQSLLMMNNPFVIQQAELLANRVREKAGTDPAAQATLAWRLVFGRTAFGERCAVGR